MLELAVLLNSFYFSQDILYVDGGGGQGGLMGPCDSKGDIEIWCNTLC